jgi:hypothetical protein
MGEAGHEIVAPEKDFMTVTKALVASGAKMYQGIVNSQARSNGYATTNYAPSSSQMVASGGNGGVVINCGHIVGSTAESMKVFGDLVHKANNNYGTRKN